MTTTAAAPATIAPAAPTASTADFDFESLIISIPDHPEPGVVFKDITPLLADAEGFAAVVDAIAGHFADHGITKVVCAEARGFMVGAPVARALGAGFVPARKPGKLPRESLCEAFELEYGTDELHIHTDALTADDVVLIVDDLVATGGTANAQVRLIERFGAQLAGMGFLMELAFLNPRETIATATDVEVFSLVQVQ
ncbi:adenine phosphoribosyltransferase [Adlercreutzia sp. ZJ242]|uniref:adenine phosphoribosyltransferase n=1 Tax=Adlercreutzia sp. ZJ242 TaxID=2709409 RepID=UPI0013EB1277|nr:adenine phosphoribosyltransferase [Adlercreutzia sp. ZJ242]